jgi:Tol biopolymer transport system component
MKEKSIIVLAILTIILAASPLRAMEIPEPEGSIIFASDSNGNYDLWCIDADGSDTVNLTNTPQINEDYPQVSPDLSMISYITTDDQHLWVRDIDGSNPREISSNPALPIYSWSPDSQWIAYIEAVSWHNYIHRVDVHTYQDITLLNKNCFAPVFSPDGEEIVFSYCSGGWFTLGAIGSDGSNERVIAPDTHSTFGLWLSDSTILYTWSPVGQAASLCTVSPDSTNRDCSFNNGLVHGRMACSLSPDGSRIAASIWDHTLGGPDYTGRIALLDHDGQNPAWITDETCNNLFSESSQWWSQHVWSPDSNQIVYQSDSSGTWDLMLADRDGGNRRILYDSGGNDVHPCWWIGITESIHAIIDLAPNLFEVEVGPENEQEEPEEEFIKAFIKLPAEVDPAGIDISSVILSINDTVLATAETPVIMDNILVVLFRLDLTNVSLILGLEVTKVEVDQLSRKIDIQVTTAPSQPIDLIKLSISGEFGDGGFNATDAVRVTLGQQ